MKARTTIAVILGQLSKMPSAHKWMAQRGWGSGHGALLWDGSLRSPLMIATWAVRIAATVTPITFAQSVFALCPVDAAGSNAARAPELVRCPGKSIADADW